MCLRVLFVNYCVMVYGVVLFCFVCPCVIYVFACGVVCDAVWFVCCGSVCVRVFIWLFDLLCDIGLFGFVLCMCVCVCV